MDKIFVVTNVELGWDCVTGVYNAKSKEALIEYLGEKYDEETDVIHQRIVEFVK